MNEPSASLDLNRFEVLSFDCYGTLINWEEGILSVLRPILANHGKSADDATLLQLFGDFEAAEEKGDYRRYHDVLQSVVQRFGEQFNFVPADNEVRALPESIRNWKPWPDTVEALRQLQKTYRLWIISNVDDDLFAATQPKLGVKFKGIITAEQARAYKPSFKIFELALSRIEVPPARILHVGQSVYHDVIPAQALGLSTVWVNRASARSGVGAVKLAEGHPDLQVSSLAELAANIAAQHVRN